MLSKRHIVSKDGKPPFAKIGQKIEEEQGSDYDINDFSDIDDDNDSDIDDSSMQHESTTTETCE